MFGIQDVQLELESAVRSVQGNSQLAQKMMRARVMAQVSRTMRYACLLSHYGAAMASLVLGACIAGGDSRSHGGINSICWTHSAVRWVQQFALQGEQHRPGESVMAGQPMWFCKILLLCISVR